MHNLNVEKIHLEESQVAEPLERLMRVAVWTKSKRAVAKLWLVVRNVDEDIALALKQRAAANGRSAEAEHREILKSVLQRPKKRSVVDVLRSMPNVGEG